MPISPPINFPASWAVAWGEDYYGYWQAFQIKSIRQVMRWIPKGEFLMGSPEDERGRGNDEKQHTVIIKQGFWLADTACTQALWEVVMGKNPSDFKESLQNPVDSVSWDDCQDFIQKANQYLPSDFQLRLPTEAEWEYACRAGSQTPFNTGESIATHQANYHGDYPYLENDEKGKYRGKTVPVLSFTPNAWGLYQMHGNLLEWCDDVYSADYQLSPAREGSQRVLRGGVWLRSAQFLRSADRNALSPDNRYRRIGVRLAGG